MQGKALTFTAQLNKHGNCAKHNNFGGIPNSFLIMSKKKRLPQSVSRLVPYSSLSGFTAEKREKTIL